MTKWSDNEVLDDLAVGQSVSIDVELQGRHHEASDRYYPSYKGWKVEAGEQGAAPVAAAKGEVDDLDGDLPF